MKRIAVFPGQGAQSVGMGRALYEASPAARAVFEAVDEALDEKLSRVVFEGPEAELTLTRNAQPALMATSVAALRALEAQTRRPAAELVDFVAGHSLGEYSALVAAGALELADAARLLRLRGEAMQRAVPAGAGAMAAILGVDPATVEAVAAEASGPAEPCELGNDNADGQAVVSGAAAAVDRAIGIAKARGAKRAMLLQVSAPFHCCLMAPAADELWEALARTPFTPPAVPVIANVTADLATDPALIPELLRRQVTARVRWRESMGRMAELGVTVLAEFGAGRVLSGLARRALPGAAALSVQGPGDLDAAAEALLARSD
jgi:[acyl-carrier-protein] S-malonyltransferase